MVEDITVVVDNVEVAFAAVVEVNAEVEYTVLVQHAAEVGDTKVEIQVAVLATVVTALLPSTHL